MDTVQNSEPVFQLSCLQLKEKLGIVTRYWKKLESKSKINQNANNFYLMFSFTLELEQQIIWDQIGGGGGHYK
jgi:hypothetical protein